MIKSFFFTINPGLQEALVLFVRFLKCEKFKCMNLRLTKTGLKRDPTFLVQYKPLLTITH